MEYTEDDIEGRRGNERLISWLMRERFLHPSMRCERDLTPMRLEKYKAAKDHWCWRCPRENCRARISVRDGSFFANSNLSLRKLMKIVVNFMAESPARGTALRIRLTRKTVGEIYKKIRRAFSNDLVTTPIVFNTGYEYEADELYFRHVRLGHGLSRKQWVAGIYERATGMVVYYRVEDRSNESLVPPIVQRVPPGSFVYTDEWNGYSTLRDHPYHRFTVNHSAGEYARLEQVGPVQINVHINNMEGFNTWVRSKLRNRARRTIERLDTFLDEIMYRRSGRSLFAPIKI